MYKSMVKRYMFDILNIAVIKNNVKLYPHVYTML